MSEPRTGARRRRYVVASADEIPPGGRKIAVVAGRAIGVFNVDGEYYAVRNRCPHQGAALCEGRLWGSLAAPVPGEYEYDARGFILACPFHGWEFDIRTGQSWCDPERLRVASYPVQTVSADALVSTGDIEEQEGSGRVPGPFKVETYPVLRDARYIVVEI